MGNKINKEREEVLLKVLHENEIFVSNTPKKQWEQIKNVMRQFANKCIDFERESAKCKLIDERLKLPYFGFNKHTKFNILKRCWTVEIETMSNSIAQGFHAELYNGNFEKEIAKVVDYDVNKITSSYTANDLDDKTIFTIDIYIL